MIGRRLARLLRALSLAAALCALSCSQRDLAVDDPWVAEAARRHALADERLEAGDRPGARDALRGIVEAPPAAALPADDRRGVLQDTWFRLARIDLDARDARGALAAAERGLALGQGSDLFAANLLVVRGAAHEALGEGPAAAEDYHRALMINDKLLADSLNGPADGSATPGRTP
jgi:hypothetical protein